ncbi:MAG: V-type ATPase subunit [Acetivibrio ethanolgignens]
MSGILSYSGIVTKARAMGARLFTKEEYEKIASMESVADFIGFLKTRQSYRQLFEGREENSFHRNEIEGLLNYSFYQDYEKLYRFCNQQQRKILRLIFWRMETDWLKLCLHRTASGSSKDGIYLSMQFLKKYSDVKLEAVIEADSIIEFAAALQGSVYGKLLKELMEHTPINPHAIEGRLDTFCFTRIWETIEKEFAGSDKRALKDIYGKQIDLLNILWIYRTKKYYNSTDAEALPALIPVFYKLRKAELMELAGCYTPEEFLHMLEKTYYSELKEEASVEQFYKDNVAHAYRENRKKYPYSMSAVYCLLYDKMREIDRLTTALECIRYQMDAGQAIQYILQE